MGFSNAAKASRRSKNPWFRFFFVSIKSYVGISIVHDTTSELGEIYSTVHTTHLAKPESYIYTVLSKHKR